MRRRLQVMLAACLLPVAGAFPESAAPSLDERVLEAGHLPAIVEPHTQWQGFLRLRPGADIVSAAYQVCRVGSACFAPPAPARLEAGGFVRFDSANYTVAGPDGPRPVDYQAGWRLGVKWFLTDAAGNTTELPPAANCLASPDPDCLESEYLAFDVASAQRGMPAPLGVLLVSLAVASFARRRHG